MGTCVSAGDCGIDVGHSIFKQTIRICGWMHALDLLNVLVRNRHCADIQKGSRQQTVGSSYKNIYVKLVLFNTRYQASECSGLDLTAL
jgi:hypothetical protein